jgi:hypothetical protein
MVAPSPPPIIRKVNKVLNDRNNPRRFESPNKAASDET